MTADSDFPIDDDLTAPTVRAPTGVRAGRPRSTQWFPERELHNHRDPIDYLHDAILSGCGDMYETLGAIKAVAIVMSPRLHAFIHSRSDLVKSGAVKVTIGRGLFGTQTEDITVPVWVQAPAPSDFRLTVVPYETLDALRAADAVVHGLTAAGGEQP